jgi:hypothetical protein
MQGEWNNNAPYYLCKFPAEYAVANKVAHPRNVYLREDAVIPELDRWLLQKFDQNQLSQLVEELVASQDEGVHATSEEARRVIVEWS